MEMVEAGQLLWVFDFYSEGQSRRLLRFWRRELEDRLAVHDLGLEAAIQQILCLGRRQFMRGAEFAEWASLARPQVSRLFHSGCLPGKIIGHVLWLDMGGIRDFLRHRFASL